VLLSPGSSGFDRLALPRLAVYSRFEDRVDGSEFYFGSTHFDHGDDMEGSNVDCTESAKELLSFTSPVAEKYPFVWVGDFNSKTANNNAYAILTNQSASFHLNDSYYSSLSHTIVSNLSPLPEYDYDHSIDHIFYANNDGIASYQPLDWSVDMFVYGDKQQYASDHYAIISTIEIQQLKKIGKKN
jgi:endonuclease/exonuclease/phosphatase family metal-dependent hydrolase